MKTPVSVDQWLLFMQIAERGSLTETAAARDVAQSAISRQLAAIERACGAMLFERTARGVRLNEVGERLYPRVKRWIQDGFDLTREADEAHREPSGLVRLGIIESLAGELCGPIRRELESSYPKVRIHFVSGMSGRLSESLNQGVLDIALFSENTRGRSGRGDSLGRMPHVLIGAPGDPLTAEGSVPFRKLHDLPLVVPGRPYAFHLVLEHWAQRLGISLNVRLECDGLHLQKQLVAEGGLYAIVAVSAIRAEFLRKQIQAARIVQPSLDRNIILRLSLANAPSEACKVVQNIVQKHAMKLLPELTRLPTRIEVTSIGHSSRGISTEA